jgi:hypothetical protein
MTLHASILHSLDYADRFDVFTGFRMGAAMQ